MNAKSDRNQINLELNRPSPLVDNRKRYSTTVFNKPYKTLDKKGPFQKDFDFSSYTGNLER